MPLLERVKKELDVKELHLTSEIELLDAQILELQKKRDSLVADLTVVQDEKTEAITLEIKK